MNLQILIQRVDKLERQNKLMRMTIVVCLAGLVLPWVLGAAQNTRDQTIQARRLLLFDSTGKLRAFLGAGEDEESRVGLYLYDQANKRSAALFVKNNLSGLGLYGENNIERASFRLEDQKITLAFNDKQKREQIQLSLTDTNSRLILGHTAAKDDKQTPIATHHGYPLTLSCNAQENGASLITIGGQLSGGAHTSWGAGKNGSHLLLRNQNGDSRIQLKPSQEQPSIKLNASKGVPAIVILGPDGSLTSHLP